MIKILNCEEVEKSEIFSRISPTANVSETVSEIIANVRKNKDKALIYYAEKFDGAKLSSLLVSEEEINEAFSEVDNEFIEIKDILDIELKK